jgi:kinesin family protein 3/17
LFISFTFYSVYTNLNNTRTLHVITRTFAKGTKSVKDAVINLVDLAGSERQKKASTSGNRFREGCHINKSLLTLGKCIEALVAIADGKTRFR